jgi:hypothetical protein
MKDGREGLRLAFRETRTRHTDHAPLFGARAHIQSPFTAPLPRLSRGGSTGRALTWLQTGTTVAAGEGPISKTLALGWAGLTAVAWGVTYFISGSAISAGIAAGVAFAAPLAVAGVVWWILKPRKR